MDIVSLSMAKAYTDSQRLAYTEWERSTAFFDGDVDGREMIPGETLEIDGNLVYASGDVFKGGTAKRVEISYNNGHFLDAKNLRVEVTHDGIWELFGCVEGMDGKQETILAMSFDATIAGMLGVSPGTYVRTYPYDDSFYFVRWIEGNFNETIHPIDPKFLPPMGAKTINLCDHGINAWEILAKGNGVHTVTVEGVSLFNEIPPLGTDFTLTNVDGANFPVAINNVVVAYSQADSTVPMQVCFTVVGINMSFLIKADIAIVSAGGNTEIYANVSYTTTS